MARRTGIPSIHEAARELCRLVNKFRPLLTILYAENAALLAALAAAQAACAELVVEANAVRDVEQA
jgi:hypothetical protein